MLINANVSVGRIRLAKSRFKQGYGFRSQNCPIALAIKAALPKELRGSVVSVGSEEFSILLKNGEMIVGDLSLAGRCFVSDFDANWDKRVRINPVQLTLDCEEPSSVFFNF